MRTCSLYPKALCRTPRIKRRLAWSNGRLELSSVAEGAGRPEHGNGRVFALFWLLRIAQSDNRMWRVRHAGHLYSVRTSLELRCSAIETDKEVDSLMLRLLLSLGITLIASVPASLAQSA